MGVGQMCLMAVISRECESWNAWDGGLLLSARDEAPPVSAARAGASAEARREAFEALAPQKSARQGLVTLGAFWDRARLASGRGALLSGPGSGGGLG